MKKEIEQEDKTSLKWRLKEPVTTERVEKMLNAGIIDKDEARELLFSEETESEQIAALKEQVEFLRGVVDKLSTQSPSVVYKYIDSYRPSTVWMTTSSPTPYKLMGSNVVSTLKNGSIPGLLSGTGSSVIGTNTGNVIM